MHLWLILKHITKIKESCLERTVKIVVRYLLCHGRSPGSTKTPKCQNAKELGVVEYVLDWNSMKEWRCCSNTASNIFMMSLEWFTWDRHSAVTRRAQFISKLETIKSEL